MGFIESSEGSTARRKEWTCYLLMHDGEGPRGKSVEIMTPHYASPSEAACEAADYFDGDEQRDTGTMDDNDQFDCGEQAIEVCESADCKGYKIRVLCRVTRRYEPVIR
jgi:hypothetical protein